MLVHRHLLFFCFCATGEDDDELAHCRLFCFVSVHLQKMMTSCQNSSSSMFFCCVVEDDDEPTKLVIIFSLVVLK